jgi:two-component system, cell cycle response regulator DivK
MRDTSKHYPTVLVAEDHEDSRLMLKCLLEARGYFVVEAEDGLKAVEVATSEHPDLILMDMSLPLLDGLAASIRLHEQESMRALPIVIVTGHVAEKDRLKAMAAGCSAYLTKPIDFVQLDNVLHKLIPRRASTASAEAMQTAIVLLKTPLLREL